MTLAQVLVVAVLAAAVAACVWMLLATRRAGRPLASGERLRTTTNTEQQALVEALDARVQQGIGALREPGIQMAMRSRYKMSRALGPSEQLLTLQEILFDLDRLTPGVARSSTTMTMASDGREVIELLDLPAEKRDAFLARAVTTLLQERVGSLLGRHGAETLFLRAGALPDHLVGWQAWLDDGTLRDWYGKLVEHSREGIGPERLLSLLELAARDLGRRFPLPCFPKLLGAFPEACLSSEKSQASVRESLWTEFLQSQRELHHAQEQLLAREKMAALGTLVAGVAHEINTPLGIALTALSHLHEKLRDFGEQFKQGQIKKSQLQELLSEGEEATRLALDNLRRGATLVASFKKVAVDQTSEERRKLSLRVYLDEVLESLKPLLRKSRLQVSVSCPDVVVDTYPGAISQILTNFIQNSMVHAYEPGAEGRLTVDARVDQDRVTLVYADDGKGIPPEIIGRIFEPFFTTKRGSGGSGLGMHVVHNLVTEVLRGEINVESEPGRGSRFTVRFAAQPGGTS